jgi:type VII secretion integral membrane protein EccD
MAICRVSIQTDRGDAARTVDVAVCAQIPIEALLPALNDATQLWPRDDHPRQWRLDRPVGGTLDGTLSLQDNGVHDGDVLILTSDQISIPQRRGWDPARVIAASDTPQRDDARLREALATAAVLIIAVALAWSAIGGRTIGHLVVATCGTFVVCLVALSGRHQWLSVAGAALAGAAGLLAVPSGPAAPNVFLASTAAFATSVVMTRLSGRLTEQLTALAMLAAVGSVVSAVAVFVALPGATLGVILTMGALGLLAFAPRIAIALSGLRPRPDHAAAVDTARSQLGHVALTGVVVGASVTVVIGLVQVTVGCLHADVAVPAVLAFVCVVGVVTLTRARTYVDAARRLALCCTGLLSATSALVVVVAVAPQSSYWMVAVMGALAVCALRLRAPSAVAKRVVDLIGYAAPAALVPLACWVVGGYAFARNLHLT